MTSFTSETAREAGRKGGLAVSAEHGTDHYVEMGRKGGLRANQVLSPADRQAIGRKGGAKTAERGPEYFRAIARKRWEQRVDR